MKRTLQLLLFFICINSKIDATNDEAAINQLVKQVIPPSPTAAAFARYGEYPVSLSTGVPQIDIPIYTIEMPGFKLPISISYHASGIKVTDVATPVGLGWVLNAGGIISRTTCGKCDISKHHTMEVTSSSQVSQYMSDNSKPISFWDELLSGQQTGPDSQSDRYSYNFNGKYGTFRYDIETGEIKTIPFSPINIKITDNGYKIIDTDGMEYYFEQEEQSNISSPSSTAVFTTSWYMSKIKNPNTNDSIRFIYKSGTAYNTYYPSQCVDVGVVVKYEYPYMYQSSPSIFLSQLNDSKYSWTRVFNLPILLDSIVWDDNIINFTYLSDRSDIYKDRLTKLSVACNGTKIKEAVFGNSSYWGTSSSNYRMRLDNIVLQGTDNSNAKQKYLFTYDSTELPDYYDMNKSTAFRCSEDYWGYFNGVQSQYLVPDRYCVSANYSTDRTPKEVDMKACSLTQITYPTGGTTVFDYEINKVLGAYDYNYATEAEVGGLRIKTIANKDKDGTILNVKNYEYSGVSTNKIRYEMYSSTMNYIYFHMYCDGNERNDEVHKISVAHPVISLTDCSGSPVFYSTVTEYNGTSSCNSGKIVYNYIQDLDNLGDCDINSLDELKFYSEFNNCDQGVVTPLLASQSTYKKSGNSYVLKQLVENSYLEKKTESFITGVFLNRRDIPIFTAQSSEYFSRLSSAEYLPYDSEFEYYESIAYSDILAFRGVRVLASTSTTDYDDYGNSVTITKNYSYDPELRIMSPTQTSQLNSNGDIYTVINVHPFDLTDDVYVNMTKSNNVDPVIRSMEYLGSSLLKTTYNEYKSENGKFLIDNVQLAKGTYGLEKRIVYNKYDSYGNPLEIVIDNNTKIVYLWGYSSKYPVAKIEGATYDEVKNLLTESYINSLSGNNSISQSIGDYIRSKLSSLNVHITTYIYKPLVGIASITDPNGKNTTYTYDDTGRLIKIIDHNNKPIESYEYNYKH